MSQFEIDTARALGEVKGLVTGLHGRLDRLEGGQDTIFVKLGDLPTTDHEVRLTKLEAVKPGATASGMSKKQTSLILGLAFGLYEGIRALVARKVDGGG